MKNTRATFFTSFLDFLARGGAGRANRDEIIVYGDLSLPLPSGHALPALLANHPRYDSFLPHFAQFLPRGAGVVDVGANVGDTLFGMVAANRSLRFICIEAEPLFYRELEKNVQFLRAQIPAATVTTVGAFVGNHVGRSNLAGTGGTKHASPDLDGLFSPRSLDSILAEEAFGTVDVLKCDVDGWDWDVLLSSMETISVHRPIVYCEMFFETSQQFSGYLDVIHKLTAFGYDNWVIFDNFGEVILRAESGSFVIQILEYLRRQSEGKSTRTIHYIDVLAFLPGHEKLVNSAVSGYLS